MQDEVAMAHATLSRAKSYLDTLGPTMTTAVTQPAAVVAMLAGDPETAEMHLRLEYESLSEMGDKGILATTAALLARAIAAQGEKRYAEATELIAISQEVAADEDTSAQVICLGLSARILADRGRHAEAVELAFSAVALAEQTDQLSPHADALLELAQALAASGRTSGAHDAATQALELYQRKGNLPGIREALGCFTQHALI
jgi:tetratricopeptide (TPR) repeat protein